MKTPSKALNTGRENVKAKKPSARKKAAAKFRRKLLKWHKRLGILSAVFVILLSVTGILLNHTSSLNLGRTAAPGFALPFYGIDTPDVRGVLVDELWFLQANDSLYLNNQLFSRCSGELVGAAAVGDFNAIACSEDLILLTAGGDLVETMSRPLSSALSAESVIAHVAIAECLPRICLRASDQQVYAFDLDTLEVEPLPESQLSAMPWAQLRSPPSSILKDWSAQHFGQEITWERLILDIHAGRFLGSIGPWFMDFIALLFIFLAATGIYLWVKNDRQKSKRS